jgi:hypothetical protein
MLLIEKTNTMSIGTRGSGKFEIENQQFHLNSKEKISGCDPALGRQFILRIHHFLRETMKHIACITFAVIAALCSAQAAHAEELIDATVKVYSQIVTFKVPKGWKGGSRSDSGGAFRLELIPAGEKVESWTSMLTVSGYRGLAAQFTAQKAYEIEAESVVKACPNDAVNQIVRQPKVNEYESVYALIGCKKHPAIPNRNEIGFYTFIRGAADVYMIKKSFREPLQGAQRRLTA